MAGDGDNPSGPVSHSEVFSLVSGGKREQILETVRQDEVSLGMVDPITGR